MNLKRLFRLAVIGGAVAAGVAAVRALTRDNDPLPSPADGPTEPWPPLRAATAPTVAVADKIEAPDKIEEPTVVEPDPIVEPEPVVEPDEASETVEIEDEPTDSAEPEPLLSVVSPAPESNSKAKAGSASTAKEKSKPPKRRRSRPLRATWMPPNDDGSCPDGYPLKANDQSKIFHAPGQMSYDRTVPERCYADADAAVADGYRAAKR